MADETAAYGEPMLRGRQVPIKEILDQVQGIIGRRAAKDGLKCAAVGRPLSPLAVDVVFHGDIRLTVYASFLLGRPVLLTRITFPDVYHTPVTATAFARDLQAVAGIGLAVEEALDDVEPILVAA